MRQQAVDLFTKRAKIGEVHQPDRAASDLVLIGRPDAALGRADAGARVGGLAQSVELLMQRKDQRHVLGNAQIVRRDLHALAREAPNLFQERAWIEYHAVANYREFARPLHARWPQR